MLQRVHVSAFAVVAADQIVIDGSLLKAVWLLLAVLGVVLVWALLELGRRRRAALRLDRLAALADPSRYPAATAHSKDDYDALIDGISLDDRLPAIAARIEAMHAAREHEPVDEDADFTRS